MTAAVAAPSASLERSPEFHVELTGAEQSALAHLACQLAQTDPRAVDDSGWLTECRRLSCRLPERLMEAIRRYRHDPGVDGTLFVSNLPIDERFLPATPDAPDSVERTATMPASVAMLLGQQLGEVMAYRDEKHGALVQDVVPVPSLETSQSNAGSVAMELHVENAFHPSRPDYVGLLCLRAAREHEVGTLVSSIRRALPLLDAAARAIVQEPRFVTATPPSFSLATRTDPHPILSGCAEDPDIRADFNATSALDDRAAEQLSRLRDAMVAVRSTLVLRPREMVFVDNRVVMHGRSAFTPRYDGQDRWLHRVFVQLDNRRSRSCRAGNGPVLA